MNRRFTLAALTALLIAAAPASAALFQLEASLDGAQANAGAGTGSTGTGTATVTYDDATNELAWNIVWSDLIGTETLMHFHGPANPGQNATVQVDIGGNSGLVSPSIGSDTITPAQAADLLNNLWYINLHTSRNSGGEIRGQVILIPEPATLGLLTIGGLTALTRRRRA